MFSRSITWILIALVAFAVGATAQDQQKVIKHVPVKDTSPASGQEMYTNYCAVCHARTGKAPAQQQRRSRFLPRT